MIAGLSDRRAGSWKRFVSNVIEWILSPKMILRLALCILVIALTTTHSRMGNTAFFSSLLVAGVIGFIAAFSFTARDESARRLALHALHFRFDRIGYAHALEESREVDAAREAGRIERRLGETDRSESGRGDQP